MNFLRSVKQKNHLKRNLEKIVHDWPLWKNPVFLGKNNKFSKKTKNRTISEIVNTNTIWKSF